MSAAGTVAAGDAGTAAGLEPELSRQRARIQRSRLGVLLRRHAILALALAIVLEVLALVGLVPQLVVAVVPLVVLAATIGWALRLRLSLAAVAQLLDERLGLFDRLGTALELERRCAGNGGARGALERRAVVEATALVEDGAARWRPRSVGGSREWAAAAAALLVLAALVVVAIVPGTDSGAAGGGDARTARGAGEGPNAKAKAAGNKKALEQYLGGPSTPRPAEQRRIARGEQIRPAAGYRQPGKAGGQQAAQVRVTEQQQNPTHVQYGFRFKDEALGNKAYEAQPGGPKARDPGSEGQAVAGGAKGAGKGGDAKGGNAPANGGQGNGPGAGTGKNGAGQGQGKAPPGTPTGARAAKPGAQLAAPASKAAAGAKGQSSQGAPGSSPSGAATAGNGAGGNRTGESLGFKGEESQELKLQSGYAPFHAGKGRGTGGKAGERQGGGGKSRSAAVEGGAGFGAGGSFALVPATGGATAAAGGSQLAQNYSAALRWLEALPW